MARENLKREIIDWIASMEDSETLDFLKIIKDSKTKSREWWGKLHSHQSDMEDKVLLEHAEPWDTADMATKKRFGF